MAEDLRPLDIDWLRANPLPMPDEDTDKNGRGRVLAVGGCRTVPGGVLLTVEAALRAGAGKVQVATIESAAMALGVAMPEVAVFALKEDAEGQIAPENGAELRQRGEHCDVIVAGPAIGSAACGAWLAEVLIAGCPVQLVLDAGVLMGLARHAPRTAALALPPVLTPHVGELAAMLDCEAEAIERDRLAAVEEASRRFGAICVLKGARTLVAAPEMRTFTYTGGGVGLATGGSGDVLAGIAAGLCARGVEPLKATLWAVWLHGEAGRRCAEAIGPVGYLARELLGLVPGLMRGP